MVVGPSREMKNSPKAGESGSCRYWALDELSFFEADSLGGHDDMVQDLDAEQLAGVHQSFGDAQVLGGGLQAAAGVVMGQDD